MAKHRGHKSKPKKNNTRPKDGGTEDYPAPRLSKLNGVKGTNNEYIDKPPKQMLKGKGRLLVDAKDIPKDIALVERALRERWEVRNKGMLQRRLLDVVAKTSVTVLTKAGPFDSEEAADANAIAASKVLVAMNAQDQDDDHAEAKLNKDTAPTTVVNVLNTESGQSRILQLAKSLGAREIIIDGKPVRPTNSVGEFEEAGVIQSTAIKPMVSDSTLAKARAILNP